MVLFLTRKTDLHNSTMSGLLLTQNFSVTFNKVNWPTLVDRSSYIVTENSILFPPAGANIKGVTRGMLFLGN